MKARYYRAKQGAALSLSGGTQTLDTQKDMKHNMIRFSLMRLFDAPAPAPAVSMMCHKIICVTTPLESVVFQQVRLRTSVPTVELGV